MKKQVTFLRADLSLKAGTATVHNFVWTINVRRWNSWPGIFPHGTCLHTPPYAVMILHK